MHYNKFTNTFIIRNECLLVNNIYAHATRAFFEFADDAEKF